MGAMVCAVIACARREEHRAALLVPRLAGLGAATLAIVGGLALIGVARQQIVFGLNENPRVPPAARDIWTAVREKTPTGALLFTDQTGPEPYDQLRGWNTYATTGQRQIYLAGWYQSPELRQAPQLLAERLKLNEAVLTGRMRPAGLHFRRGPYSAYFAVVSREHPMPSGWLKQYENSAYALYRYQSTASQ